MPRYRESVRNIFQKAGIDITPLSCVLVPVTHFATVKKTTIKTRCGDSYDAAILILPMDRLGRSVQEVPFGEESFCSIPSTRTTIVQDANPRTYVNDTIHMILTWEQLRRLKDVLGGSTRPRKVAFQKAMDILQTSIPFTEAHIDQARRQYYAYAGGPLDEVELLGMYDAGLYTGEECTMDDIVTFLPNEVQESQILMKQAYNQWKAVTSSREMR